MRLLNRRKPQEQEKPKTLRDRISRDVEAHCPYCGLAVSLDYQAAPCFCPADILDRPTRVEIRVRDLPAGPERDVYLAKYSNGKYSPTWATVHEDGTLSRSYRHD